MLIDNAAHSFGFQIDNGVPMLPFYRNKEDTEMIHLYHYLQKIANEEGKQRMLIFRLANSDKANIQFEKSQAK